MRSERALPESPRPLTARLPPVPIRSALWEASLLEDGTLPRDNAYLSPGFLVASPRMDGSTFERAVILVVHHDEDGAMGFIVNKPLSVNLGELLETADETLPGEIAERCFGLDVQFGGPVRMEQLWLIYRDDGEEQEPEASIEDLEERGCLQVAPRWRLIADSDSIEVFLYGEREDPFRPFIGYTGWGAGQLEGEMEEGSWLHLPFEGERVFEDRDQEEAWHDALKRIGVDPFAFLMMGGLAKS